MRYLLITGFVAAVAGLVVIASTYELRAPAQMSYDVSVPSLSPADDLATATPADNSAREQRGQRVDVREQPQQQPTQEPEENSQETGATESESVSEPGPLTGPTQRAEEGATLTRAGIVRWVNVERVQRDLPPLSSDELLQRSAQGKTDEMLTYDYFAHDSPITGDSIDDLVDAVGYEYVQVGENLARGNFEDDKDLVAAWMDSPGHRANILSDDFTEIGIAVTRGEYKGRQTWMAVQHFAKPASACPQIDKSLDTAIEDNRDQLDALSAAIDEKKQRLEQWEERRDSEYRQVVEEYNEQVDRYNALLQETRDMIETYNEQVNAFNACAQ
jgi:uncharacterized protein YkwD